VLSPIGDTPANGGPWSRHADTTRMAPTAANENEGHVRVADAARLLRAHPVTVRAWIRAGLLPAAKVGSRGHWRIPRSALLDLGDKS